MAIEMVPYTNYHDLNLDWILEVTKEAKDKIDNIDTYSTRAEAAAEAAEQSAGNAHTDAEAANTAKVDAALYEQNARGYAGSAAQSYNDTYALYTDLTGTISADVTQWLNDNITPGSGYVLDDTLTVQGAAADAKAAGDAIRAAAAEASGNSAAIQLMAIEQAKIAGNLADFFLNNDPTHVYTVGDYCVNNNVLYRCIASTTGGTFDSAAWSAVTVAQELETVTDGALEVLTNDKDYTMVMGYINASTGAPQGTNTYYRRTARLPAYGPGLKKITITPKLPGTQLRAYYYTDSIRTPLASYFVSAEPSWANSIDIVPDPTKPYMIVAVYDPARSDMSAYSFDDLVDEKLYYNTLDVLASESEKNRPVYILAIGNSYTYYSFSYLAKILQDAGYTNVVLGMGYQGSATLKEQYDNRASTSFYSNGFVIWPGNGVASYTYDSAKSLDDIIAAFPWTHVIIQQQSDDSGQYDSFVSSTFDVNDLLTYVKTGINNPNLRVALFAPWTHAADYNGVKYQTYYNADQDTFNAAIRNVIPQVAAYMSQCDFIINELDAFDAARENRFLRLIGDEMMMPDANHPAHGIPMFLASFVIAATLLDVSASDVNWFPVLADDSSINTTTSAFYSYLAKQYAENAKYKVLENL